MARITLTPLRKTLLTPDTAEALRQLELRASQIEGARLVVNGPTSERMSWHGVQQETGGTGCPPELSMRPTGRELNLRIQLTKLAGLDSTARRRVEVETLWGIAVPCGFTPWNRYPIQGPTDEVFHYLGPWQMLYDSLLGEGLGEMAWPSVCAAAQLDVGKWGGDRGVERTIQAHLHRLGLACGPVDGVITSRVVSMLRATGLQGMASEEAARRLEKMENPPPTPTQRTHGFISLSAPSMGISTGKIAMSKTAQGYAVTVDGPGRIIIDVGE